MYRGTHHAHFSYGYGFCVFNDLAYTAINLIEEKLVKNVLILDFDVHQGMAQLIFVKTIHLFTHVPYIVMKVFHLIKKKDGWI